MHSFADVHIHPTIETMQEFFKYTQEFFIIYFRNIRPYNEPSFINLLQLLLFLCSCTKTKEKEKIKNIRKYAYVLNSIQELKKVQFTSHNLQKYNTST